MKRSLHRLFLMCLAFLICFTGFSLEWTSSPAMAASAVNRTNDPLNGDWSKPYAVKYDTTEADLMVRVGDIDNLGGGWPNGYDPFSGKSTGAPYPKVTHQPTDPAGTDQLMVISSFQYPDLRNPKNDANDHVADGYTRNNYSKTANPVVPIKVTFDTKNTPIEGAILQMFINDYQPRKYPGRVKYTAELNGVRAPFLENVINSLNQHGPIGKLISVQIPDEYLPLLKDGSLTILLDDKTTRNPYGDGAAIDFVKLLINLGEYKHTGTIKGKVTDSGSPPKPLAGAVVSAGGIVSAVTNAKGEYILQDVPAGLVSVEAAKDGYIPQLKLIENFEAGDTAILDFQLAPQPSDNAYLQNLTVKGETLVPLEPGFDRSQGSYDVHLNSHVQTVAITPTLEDSRASMTVNGESHQSGTPKVIPVKPGATKVTIVVTAQDGKTKRTYEVTIHTPLTSVDLARSLSQSAIKLGETSVIRYTVTPKSFSAEGLADKPAGRATGIRPFFLLNQPFVYGKGYDIGYELDKVKVNGKGNSNNGGLALGGRGKSHFLSVMRSGYSGEVSVNQQLTAEPSAKQDDILDTLKDLIRSGVKEITIPLVDESQLADMLKGRDSVTVNAFATFGLSVVNNRVIANFAGYGPLPETFAVTDVTLTEPFPAEVPIESIDKSWSKRSDNGTLTLKLPDITYERKGDVYQAAPVSFGITVKPTRTGTYLLSDSQLTYREGNAVNSRFFNNLTLQVDTNIPPVTGLKVTPEKASILVGETVGLKARITPDNADQSVIWTSADSKVATVSSNGIVTGVKPGRAVITARTPDGKFSSSSEITVTSKPVLDLAANNGWDAMYPEKAVVTAEVIDFPESFPMKLTVKVGGAELPASALYEAKPSSLGDGRQKVTYTFEVEAARKKSGEEIGEVLRVGPTPVQAEAKNASGKSADPVSNTLLLNPVTAFAATLEREGSPLNQKGSLKAEPTTLVMEDVKFFWMPGVDLSEVGASSPWVPFNLGNKATGIPLNPSGPTTLVVGMFQDFNRDGNYAQPDGTPDENEIVVREVSLGQPIVPPDFELSQGLTLPDSAKVIVTPVMDTVDEHTQWFYRVGTGEWQSFPVAFDKNDKGKARGEFLVDYVKVNGKYVDTPVAVKAVNPLNGDIHLGIPTVKTAIIEVPKPGSGGGGGDPDYDDLPNLYVRVNNGTAALENRAVQVEIGYSFRAEKDLELAAARYAIGDSDGDADLLREIVAGKGTSILNGKQNKIVKNLKTSSGQSQTYQIAIFVKVNIYHSLTGELLESRPYQKIETVTVKAKNNLN